MNIPAPFRLLAVVLVFVACLAAMVVYEHGLPPERPVVEYEEEAAEARQWSYTLTPWSASVSTEKAVGDSLLRFPGAVGWGAEALPCQDSLRAGTGQVMVWKVTETSGTGAGSYRAALDSAMAHSAANVCPYIIFPQGGTYTLSADPNYDGIQNLRISGQTAQGGGANIGTANNVPRTRDSDGITWEYLFGRIPGAQHSPWSGDQHCSRGWYLRHLSGSWTAATNGNLITLSCGTNSVPMTGVFSRNHTIERNLLFEPDATSPTHIHTGGWEPEGGVTKMGRTTIHENYTGGPGHRHPNLSECDSCSVMRHVSYNGTTGYANSGSIRGVQSRQDLLNSLYRPGPSSQTGASRRWATRLQNMESGDTISMHVAGLRTEQNNYDLTTPTDSLHRGSKRSTACLQTVNAYPGECQADGDSIPMAALVNDTLLTAWSARAEVPLTSITDTERDRIIQIAGNHRYLLCSGEWSLRSDSVDTRARQEWLDSLGASSPVDGSSRSYPAPASGTACADADDDGLPDTYESEQCGTTTCLAVDSMSLGRPAIEWYLDGRDLSGTSIGEPTGASGTTFGAGGRVYATALVARGRGQGPDPAVVPIPTSMVSIRPSSKDSVLVCTPTDHGTPLDSAAVESRMADWWPSSPSLRATYLRDLCPPGGN